MFPLLGVEVLEAVVDGPGVLIGSFADQRIEDVGDGHDASDDRDVFPVQTVWIP